MLESRAERKGSLFHRCTIYFISDNTIDLNQVWLLRMYQGVQDFVTTDLLNAKKKLHYLADSSNKMP